MKINLACPTSLKYHYFCVLLMFTREMSADFHMMRIDLVA